jgi:hypothetical protein
MVQEYTSPCLVYEPGKAPTGPPEVFKADGVVIVTPDRPEVGHGGDSGGNIVIEPPFELLPHTIISDRDNSTVFDLNYNFFRYPNAKPNTKYRTVSYINDIFNNSVNEDVVKIINSTARNYYVDTHLFYSFHYKKNQIEKSLNPSLLKDLEGKHYSYRNKVMQTISETLLLNDLSSLSLKKVREVAKSLPENVSPISLEEAYNKFLINSVPLAPDKHPNLIRQKELQTWKTFPTDLDKKLQINLEDGSVEYTVIGKDDSFLYTTSSGSTSKIYINDGDTVTIRINGILTNKPISTLINSAYVLPQEINEELILRLSNTPYTLSTVFTGTSTADTEMTQNLSATTVPYTVYKLVPSSVTDLDSDYVGIRKSSYSYTKFTSTSSIDAYVKFKAFPAMILPISNEDPLVSLIVRDNSLSVTATDLDFRNLGDKFVPRNIPYYIIVTPTDNIKLNNFKGLSKLETIVNNAPIRSINFVYNVIKENKNKGLSNDYLVRNYSYPGVNINNKYDTQGIYYTFEPKERINNLRFESGEERLPKRSFGLKRFLEITEDIQDNYDLSGNTLTWFDVLSRMTFSEIFYMINNLAPIAHTKLSTGSLSNTLFTAAKRNQTTGLTNLTGSSVGGVISNPNSIRILL